MIFALVTVPARIRMGSAKVKETRAPVYYRAYDERYRAVYAQGFLEIAPYRHNPAPDAVFMELGL